MQGKIERLLTEFEFSSISVAYSGAPVKTAPKPALETCTERIACPD
jgi:hypothetical protein